MAQRVGRGIALLFHDCGVRREWVVSSTPRPHFTPGKTRYPLYRRLGGPQGRSGRAKFLVPTGIRSRTVQSVVSRYTDRTSRPTSQHLCKFNPTASYTRHYTLCTCSNKATVKSWVICYALLREPSLTHAVICVRYEFTGNCV